MGPVARAWCKAQDPALVRAIRHAFCEHSHQPGMRGRCRCLTEQDRAVLSSWVERAVARGYPSVVRVDRHGNRVGSKWGRAELMGAEGRYEPVTEPCWFPFCRKGLRHTGQHSGIREAGARLVEMRALARDMLAQDDPRPLRAEDFQLRMLLQLAVEAL